jgi:hypothetical protein
LFQTPVHPFFSAADIAVLVCLQPSMLIKAPV